MNKKYVGVILIFVTMLVSILCLINIGNEDNNNPKTDDNNLLAIYLQTSNNADSFRKSAKLPSKNDNYVYSYAKCVYYNDKNRAIENPSDLISYDYDESNNGVIKVHTNKAITCDLYFSIKS